MDFILFAMGTPPGGEGGGGIGSFLPMFAIIMLIFYFLIMRPEQRKKKAHQETLKNVKKGDKIVTIGGIHGVVVGVEALRQLHDCLDFVRRPPLTSQEASLAAQDLAGAPEDLLDPAQWRPS